MKKFINGVENILSESLTGFGKAHSDIIKINHDSSINNLDKRALDLYLISQCNHHITIPSSFNWWGAYLSKRSNNIICRPDDSFFSNFYVNNKDFWPSNWINIS